MLNNFILRNRLGENIPVNPDVGINNTLVNNEYIDVVKKEMILSLIINVIQIGKSL